MYSNFLLTQTYVTINVITAVVVTDTISVTIHATATTAPVDKESDSELSNPSDPVYTQVVHTYLIINMYVYMVAYTHKIMCTATYTYMYIRSYMLISENLINIIAM